ncbi:MAG: alpha/beta hydrolase [Alphaproteobacteria bacterium]
MNAPAPLLEIPELPVPKGGAAEWFEGEKGARLRAAIYPASGKAGGSVVLSPGRIEPIEKYHEVIAELQGRGFVVLCHDWRGQGLSDRMLPDRMKGHAQGAELFRKDYERLLTLFEARLPKPWIQMGHSMGGGLSLYVLAKGENRFSASALSSPMLGVVTTGFGYSLARALTFVSSHIGLASRYLFGDPDNTVEVTFEKDKITHDRGRWDKFKKLRLVHPDLALGNLTWGWLEFAMSMTAWLRKPSSLQGVTIPVLIVASANDDRVLITDTRKAAARLPNCRLIEIPESWHEVLMETDEVRAIWWRAFDELAATISPSA